MAKKTSCGDLFVSLGGSIYNNTVFNRFFEQNDPIVLGWAENVLAKLKAEGILPTFLQKKDNEDFKAYWGTITHLFALVVIYARKYKEIDSNKILFETFIQNKGLLTDLVDSQEQMEYLFYNYLNEYGKRGRLDIVNKEGSILGELLRLIRYNSLDEFIFALLQPQNTGWVMGQSSPSWSRTNTIINVTKAYEFTSDIVDLEKYPLLRSANIGLIKDRDSENELINVMTFSGNQTVGIQGSPSDLDKYILIDPNISYEISLKVKINSLQNQNLKFGVSGFDSNKSPVNFSVLQNLQYGGDSNWFHSSSFLNLLNNGVYYELKGIILAYNQRYLNAPVLNFPSGRALSMKPSMKFITPTFIQERSSNSDPLVYLYDFKVKPLTLPFEQGYLGARDIIASYYKNNAFQKETAINLFLGTYLLSYKNVFGSLQIETLNQASIIFKVFSDRNKYVQNAIITLGGTPYRTNINGEVLISLYPGEYSYSITASEFDPIDNAVLTVESSSRTEYVQLKGTVYERTVAFSVKSGGVPLSRAKVTFNEQTQITGANGLVFFEAFVGIYSYKIEKDDYYTISRNISIEDSTTIEIDLLPIPYYNVSFRVRDGINPVAGAAVIVTGDFDGDGTITEQTGSTNEQGVATGFTMREGTYHYKISKVGFVSIENDFNIIGNATIEIPISPVPKYKITFIVKNNALPVEGANVNFNGVTLITDALGKVIFNEPNGEYNYNITKTEFLTQSGALTVAGADVVKTIDFIQIGYLLKFIVKDDAGNVLPGVKVTTGLETITTNTSGEAEFIRISGSYNWGSILNGYYQETGVAIVNGQNVTVEVKMVLITYNAIFTVRINGQVLSDQPVMCNGVTQNTDYQGIVRFNLPPGSYGWSVTKPAYDPQSGTVLLVDRDVAVNVDLAATKGTIVLTVRDSVSTQLLDNVAITINGETKYTAATGQVSFALVLGSYNYVAGLGGYNSNEGTLQVVEGISGKEILMVKAAEKTYSIIFTAKEGSTLLPGVNISLDNGLTGITNDQGQAIFTVVSGIYNYTASYNSFFDDIQSSVTVSNANAIVSLNFIRKTTSVTFKVKDSISLDPVGGVSIEFNNQTKTTNTLGDVTFTNIPMSSNSLRYVATKNPPYKDFIETTKVTSENPIIEIKMGQYTYNLTFTVKTNTGVVISNAFVSCNGKSGTTDSAGQVTLQGFINGTYNYTVTNSAYQTVTDSITVTNANAFPNVVMAPIYNATTIHVQFNASVPAPGVSVKVGSNTIATDASGNAIFSLKDGDYSYTVGENSNYFPVTGSFKVASFAQAVTVTIEDVFTLEVATPSTAGFTFLLPITNTSSTGLSQLKVDWGDGTPITTGQKQHLYSGIASMSIKVKISMGGSSDALQWGFRNAYSNAGSSEAGTAVKNSANAVRKILQWFQAVSKINFLDGGFAFCKNLTSVGSIKGSQCSGMPASMFMECSSLTSIPNGFFNWQSNNGDFTNTFLDSALSGSITPSFFSGISIVIGFDSAFAGTKITGATFTLPDGPYSAASAFAGCSLLTVCTAFQSATRITDLSSAFLNCKALNTWPIIGGIVTSLSLDKTFSGCSVLPGNTIADYLPRNATICDYCFYGCSNISSFSTGLFGNKITSLKHTFQLCAKLTSITNTKVPADLNLYHVTSMEYAYASCGVTNIPAEFFKGMYSILSFVGTFENCKSLININAGLGTGIFSDCSPTSVAGCFAGCSALNSTIRTIFGWYGSPTTNTKSVARSCTNYSSCFSGCINLTSEAPYLTPDIQVFYIYEWAGKEVKAGGATLYTLPSAIGTSCFKGCTKMLYYSDIPSNWK